MASCRRKRVSASQLRRGIAVEHEHTRGVVSPSRARQIARKIACDHLLEFPDYYTRLDRMEAEALRAHRRRT
jgi:hypothetical protein